MYRAEGQDSMIANNPISIRKGERRQSVASKAWLEDLFLKGDDYGTARNT